MSSVPIVFDRRLLRKRRDRIASNFDEFDFLKRRAAEDLIDSLTAVTRSFDIALDLGSHGGVVHEILKERTELSSRISTWINLNQSSAFAQRSTLPSLVADEEALPFKENTFDLIVSALSLHWVNDLPGSLVQVRNALKPDGFFVAQLLGGATLKELRSSLLQAESQLSSGAAMRVSPFADVQDMASLLQRAGFAMPVADTHTITVRYKTAFDLLQDIKNMGESSALAEKSPPLSRASLLRAVEIYHRDHADEDGRVRATFEFLTISGWAPGPGQPKPLRPGSATSRLADALGSTEQSFDN